MRTLTEQAIGAIGQFRPATTAIGVGTKRVLSRPTRAGGKPLMQCLESRQSGRDFRADPLTEATLADLLWAVAGVNRHDLGGRTAPSAMNAQEVDLYIAMPTALCRYDATEHELHLVLDQDVRAASGRQGFAADAPLDLIFVADHSRMKLVPAEQRSACAYATAGAMAQNAYLYCASEGLSTVMRTWFDHDTLAIAMGLCTDQQLLLAQTVGLAPLTARPPRPRA